MQRTGRQPKAKKALATINQEQEQNKVHMYRVQETQQTAKEAERIFLRLVDSIVLLCYTFYGHNSINRNLWRNDNDEI